MAHSPRLNSGAESIEICISEALYINKTSISQTEINLMTSWINILEPKIWWLQMGCDSCIIYRNCKGAKLPGRSGVHFVSNKYGIIWLSYCWLTSTYPQETSLTGWQYLSWCSFIKIVSGWLQVDEHQKKQILSRFCKFGIDEYSIQKHWLSCQTARKEPVLFALHCISTRLYLYWGLQRRAAKEAHIANAPENAAGSSSWSV